MPEISHPSIRRALAGVFHRHIFYPSFVHQLDKCFAGVGVVSSEILKVLVVVEEASWS